ncbi:hypothetical protein FD29_GL002051 [Companilactobacillus mindensis DSM 14500]|uniref:Uncharacterized protein n=1 Tax=Companilactobacillus mindensis DSM 14500 TaxID=1423770 RepID=A0A0R1QJA9_9LACO|nr:hypothetical protein FD29_GL002051 [Companilactobacillus mindensis DSM 14500]
MCYRTSSLSRTSLCFHNVQTIFSSNIKIGANSSWIFFHTKKHYYLYSSVCLG